MYVEYSFLYVFIMRQVHLPPKQPYFRGSLQNSRTEIEYYANFSALSCVKDREFIFCKNSTLLSTLLQKSVFVISAKKNHCLRFLQKIIRYITQILAKKLDLTGSGSGTLAKLNNVNIRLYYIKGLGN